jgi:hypothetical protein
MILFMHTQAWRVKQARGHLLDDTAFEFSAEPDEWSVKRDIE